MSTDRQDTAASTSVGAADDEPRSLVVGDLVIDVSGREARLAGRPVPLTRIEFDIVAYLAAHPGWVVSPDQLMEGVWGYRSLGDTRVVAVHVGNVRRKLGESSDAPRYIRTVRGAGYKLVRPEPESAPSPESAVGAASVAAPVTAERAATSPGARHSVAADAVRETPGTSIVGREAEMAELALAWGDARRGHGGIVFLEGDAGIGKTRLAEEIAADVEAGGGLAAWGRCHEAEGLPAYWPWIQMLRHVIESSSDEELRHDLQASAGDVSIVVPELRRRVPGPSADQGPHASTNGSVGRDRFFRSACEYLVRSSRRRPLLLVLDDLHVADHGSLLLLQALVPELADSSVLVLATYRDGELGSSHPLTDTLTALQRGGCRRLRVEGLTPANVRSVMDASGGPPVPQALADAVHRQTAGNPLFVVELTRLLAIEGHLADTDPSDVAALPLPRGVSGVLERRVARLSQACRDLLEVAALLGDPIDLLVLSGASGRSGESLLSLVDESVAARLLERPTGGNGLRFVHPLTREVLAAGRGETERLRLHARIAETLELHYPTDPEAFLPDLAHHFARAAPLGYGPRAFDYSRLAGVSALARFGYEEAAGQYARALTLLPCSGVETCARVRMAAELHEAIGDALSLTARRSDAVQSYRRAVLLLPPDDRLTRARLDRKSGAAWLADQEPGRARACLESAEVALGPAPEDPDGGGREPDAGPALQSAWAAEKIEIALQRMAALYFEGDQEGLAFHLDAARPLIERAGSERQRSIVATHHMALAFRRERYRVSQETVAYAREHQRRLQQSGDDALVCEAAYLLGFALLWAGDLEDAERQLRRCKGLADGGRDHSRLVRASTYLSVLHRLRGDVGKARVTAERAAEQAVAAHLPGYVAAGMANLAWAALRDSGPEGGIETAAELGRQALDLWRAPSAFPFEWLARWPLTVVAVRRARPTDAREQLSRMLDPDQQKLPDGLAAAMAAASADPRGDLLEAAVREAAALNYC